MRRINRVSLSSWRFCCDAKRHTRRALLWQYLVLRTSVPFFRVTVGLIHCLDKSENIFYTRSAKRRGAPRQKRSQLGNWISVAAALKCPGCIRNMEEETVFCHAVRFSSLLSRYITGDRFSEATICAISRTLYHTRCHKLFGTQIPVWSIWIYCCNNITQLAGERNLSAYLHICTALKTFLSLAAEGRKWSFLPGICEIQQIRRDDDDDDTFLGTDWWIFDKQSTLLCECQSEFVWIVHFQFLWTAIKIKWIIEWQL